MTTVRPTTLDESVPADQPQPTAVPARLMPETELTLLLDVGTAWTKAALVGRAGGRWRIVSGAAQPTSWGESVLIDDLVGRLGPHADPRLTRRLALLVRDAPRITCRSPRRAGRLAVVADTTADLESASAIARRCGWTVAAAVAGDHRSPEAERYERLRRAGVDGWVAVSSPAGHPGDSQWGLVAAARGSSPTPVLVVGAADDQVRFSTIFGTAADWIGPSLDDHLADALLSLLCGVNGLGEVRTIAPVAFGRSIQAMAGGLGISVMGVDLGASWLGWRSVTGRADGQTALLAASANRPAPEGSHAAAEILPTDVDEFVTTDAMANLGVRPMAIPATAEEAAIAQAIGIDRLAAAGRELGGCPAVDLLVGGGRLLAGAPHPADAALVLLDGLRPPGVTQLAVDPWGICGPLGALPDEDVDEGLETLRDDLLVPLGTAVVSHGGRPGQAALHARLRRPGWPDSHQVEVRTGSVTVLPLERGALGELDIELERGVQVGAAIRSRRLRVAVTGGSVGVILDARDDPIQLPARPGDARTTIQTWRDALRREGRPVGSG